MRINETDPQRETKADDKRASDVDSRIYMFVADGMNIGGIETLLVRMANQISNLGYRVVVVAEQGPTMQSLDASVTIFVRNKAQSAFERLTSIPLDQYPDKAKLYIWATTPYLLVSLYKYQSYLNSQKSVSSVAVTGIFGPTRPVGGFRWYYHMISHLLVLGCLPIGAVYFISEAVKNSYAQQFGSYFDGWPIHKLALDQANSIWHPREGGTLKIVSIGRIVKLKPYNFGALDVVEFLVANNIPVHWNIWGHGDDESLLEKEICDRGLSSYISFKGALPYSRFRQTVLDADLFVGMGTAALEAAQLGVPTIVALAWSKLGSYGFLHQCPVDSFGEHCVGTQEVNLIDVIFGYSKYTNEQRLEIGSHCRAAVVQKSAVEPPPFNAMFEGGIAYPTSFAVSVRMMSAGAAQNIWVILENFVSLSKVAIKIARLKH